jgi:hypothetical protein
MALALGFFLLGPCIAGGIGPTLLEAIQVGVTFGLAETAEHEREAP